MIWIKGVERMLIKCADDTNLGGVANTSEDRIMIQQDYNRLQKQVSKGGKCKTFYFGK